MTSSHPITRRAALQGIAAWAGVARFAHAAEPSTIGRFVEKQPTGTEIWQVTTEEFDQSDIYGEVPYCSRDSRYFVYARRNPALKTNRTEFMLVELGSWKQQRLDTAISISGCAISHDGMFYYHLVGYSDRAGIAAMDGRWFECHRVRFAHRGMVFGAPARSRCAAPAMSGTRRTATDGL